MDSAILVFWFLFLLSATIAVAAFAVALAGRRMALWLCIVYFVWAAAAIVGSYLTTFHYEYYLNPNTRMCGWPAPHVIWQRADAVSPWKDYIGWPTILAFPINVLLYVLPISLAVLSPALWRAVRAGYRRVSRDNSRAG